MKFKQWQIKNGVNIFLLFSKYVPVYSYHFYCRASVLVREDDLGDVMTVLNSFSHEKILQMRKQLRFYWESYFSTMKQITLTTLQILNDRVFSYASKSYEDWNEIPNYVCFKLINVS